MAVPPIASLIVPQWYMDAFLKGVSKEARWEMVRKFCLEAFQERARERSEAVPETVDAAVVDLTCDMYEFAMRGEG